MFLEVANTLLNIQIYNIEEERCQRLNLNIMIHKSKDTILSIFIESTLIRSSKWKQRYQNSSPRLCFVTLYWGGWYQRCVRSRTFCAKGEFLYYDEQIETSNNRMQRWFINCNLGPCGLMDKASDFGSEDCRFESCHGRYFFKKFFRISLCNWHIYGVTI